MARAITGIGGKACQHSAHHATTMESICLVPRERLQVTITIPSHTPANQKKLLSSSKDDDTDSGDNDDVLDFEHLERHMVLHPVGPAWERIIKELLDSGAVDDLLLPWSGCD